MQIRFLLLSLDIYTNMVVNITGRVLHEWSTSYNNIPYIEIWTKYDLDLLSVNIKLTGNDRGTGHTYWVWWIATQMAYYAWPIFLVQLYYIASTRGLMFVYIINM